MKIRIALPIVALLLGACSSASAVELPTQKPGLWEVTMKSAKMPGGSRSFRMCQDAASLAAAKATAAAQKKSCSKYDIHKTGDAWISDVECTFSSMHIVSHSVTTVHGDDAFYQQITSTVGSSTTADVTTIDNKYLGACMPGQKAGVPIAVH